jgi:hypothetical protein
LCLDNPGENQQRIEVRFSVHGKLISCVSGLTYFAFPFLEN